MLHFLADAGIFAMGGMERSGAEDIAEATGADLIDHLDEHVHMHVQYTFLFLGLHCTTAPTAASILPRLPPIARALLPKRSIHGYPDSTQCGQRGHTRTP